MHGLSVQKNFSSRLNVAALREMGMHVDEEDDEGLEQMDEKDNADDEKQDDEKYDHGQGGSPLSSGKSLGLTSSFSSVQ